MNQYKTLNIKQLIAILTSIAKDKPNLKIYLSRDTEGNSYGTMDKEWSFCLDEPNQALLLFPFEDGIEYEELEA